MEAHTDSPLFRYRHWAELVALYVDPAFRCSGLAWRMMETGRHWAADRGLDRVQLFVTASNEQARRFYARAGFRPVQEIWRLEVALVSGAAPPADPSCTVGAHGGDYPETGHHHFGMELSDACDGEAE